MEAAERLLRDDTVVVTVGTISYKLTVYRETGYEANIHVRYKHVEDSEFYWYDLNRGWEFKRVSRYTRGYAIGNPSERLLALALTILQPIFAGIPVYKLTCGRVLDHPVYTGMY